MAGAVHRAGGRYELSWRKPCNARASWAGWAACEWVGYSTLSHRDPRYVSQTVRHVRRARGAFGYPQPPSANVRTARL